MDTVCEHAAWHELAACGPLCALQVHVPVDLPVCSSHSGQQIRAVSLGLPLPHRAHLHAHALLLRAGMGCRQARLCGSHANHA